MPALLIKPGTATFIGFPYPPNGKVKIFLEASSSVDLFVCNEQQRPQISSVADAQAKGIFVLGGQSKIDNAFVDIPAAWKGTSWYVLIGNAGAEAAAVYVTVNDA